MAQLDSKSVMKLAFDCGFDLCGITTPEPIEQARDSLRNWLNSGFHGEMSWMARNSERRTDPQTLMPDVRSIIMLGLNYYQPDSDKIPDGFGRVSKYARGRDYHKVIERKTKQLTSLLKSYPRTGESINFKWWVDYGPFLERAYAAKAGLGYIGKNSMLITRQFGSWVFLSEIVTDLKLEANDPKAINHGRCGKCRRCIDACPTSAIVSDGVIDARKCISYLTIERPHEIPDELRPKMKGWIFGCDICQNVCPHNGRAVDSKDSDLAAGEGVGEFLNARRVLRIQTREHFLKLTAGTPLVRPRLENLRRNAQIVLDNEGEDIE